MRSLFGLNKTHTIIEVAHWLSSHGEVKAAKKIIEDTLQRYPKDRAVRLTYATIVQQFEKEFGIQQQANSNDFKKK